MPRELGETLQFPAYEALLWRVLGVLAGAGFVASPDEARDVLHDFYLEAWDGVVRAHDSQRSAFTTYLYAAFYRFARHRIVQAQTWRRRLVDIERADELPAQDLSPDEALDARQGVAQVRLALARLPAQQRALLTDYVGEPGSSERVLAERHRLSRHAVRAALAEAVARVAAELRSLPASPSAEARVVDELWRQGRTVKRTASLLGLPESEVHRLQSRYAAGLLAAVREQNQTGAKGRIDMPDPLRFLRDALLNPQDAARLEPLREHAAAIRQALAHEDAVLSAAEFETALQAPDWVGRVYSVLGADAAGDEGGGSLSAALQRLHTDQATEIHDAFCALLSTLGPELRQWDFWFDGVPAVPERAQRQLLEESLIEPEDDDAITLARLGITPLALFSAARGLELLMNRVQRAVLAPRPGRPLESWLRSIDGGQPQGSDLGLWLSDEQPLQALPIAVVDSHIAGARHLQPDAVQPLRRWLLAVLADRPYLVDGYRFVSGANIFVTLPAQAGLAMGADLTARWCRPEQAGHDSHAVPVPTAQAAASAAPAWTRSDRLEH